MGKSAIVKKNCVNNYLILSYLKFVANLSLVPILKLSLKLAQETSKLKKRDKETSK